MNNQSITSIIKAYKYDHMNGTKKGHSGLTLEEAVAQIGLLISKEVIGDYTGGDLVLRSNQQSQRNNLRRIL